MRRWLRWATETHGEEKKRFRRICALAMLDNRSPYAEALSAQAILMVNELLPSVLPKPREWTGHKISFAYRPHCAIWASWMNQ